MGIRPSVRSGTVRATVGAAMAAVGVSLLLEPEGAVPAAALPLPEALARFRGVRRRQEIRLAIPGLTAIEDFGHHPTAIAET